MWIDNKLAYRLLENMVGDDPDDPPDFSPESDWGEGPPPSFETEYRSNVLLLLSTLYLAVRDVAEDTRLSPEQRKTRITTLVDSFSNEASTRVNRQLNTIYTLGGQAASKEILALGLYPGRGMDESILRTAIMQQENNLMSVARMIKDNLHGQIDFQTLQNSYNVPEKFRFRVNPNSAFREGKTRLDRMASYGATVVYSEGKLNVFREFEDTIQLDWVTRGDSKVCPTCHFYQSNSPYKPSEFPAPPHTGCRCYPVVVEVNRGGDGTDLLALGIMDTLLEKG